MATAIKSTRKVSKSLSLERIQQEMTWKAWFPENAKLDARKRIPDDEVEILTTAFAKFCREAVMIKRPGERVPFVLRDAQLDTVRRWMTHRNCITLKARQIGFSTLTAAFALWCALAGADRQIYLLSRRELDSVSLLSKARYAYRSMPEWTKGPTRPQLVSKSAMTMKFDNDSFIQSSPAAGDPITGETAYLVVVDEWAKFPDQEIAWASIEPVADIGGRVIGLSTAKGEGSFFHRMWVGAETGNNTFHAIFHPWWAVPDRDEEWYATKQANLEPWQLYQEYPANPEEAFQGSGNPFFDLDNLRGMKEVEPLGRYQVTYRGDRQFDYVESEMGHYVAWELPKPGISYVVGADIAQGLDHGDWTVAYVMRADTGEIVGMYRAKPEPDEFAEVLMAVGYWYNCALACPEANNHGRSTIDNMRRMGYQRIYRRRSKLKRHDAPTETIGWLTTHGNKFDLVNDLAVWLREHNVPDAHTVAELKTFQQTQKGERIKLHGSPHDDCVMALALTVEARKYAVANRIEAIKPAHFPGSIEWWSKKLQSSKKRTHVRPGL